MRLSRRLSALALSLAAFAAGAATATASETTKTLKLDLSPSGAFAVENLAGVMKVTAGGGDKVVATVTVHAESDDVASLMRFEQVSDGGVTTLRVIYPTDKYTTFRYKPEADSQEEGWGGWLSGWLGGSSTSVKYAGHKVKVSENSGVLLYANVEVQLPRRGVDATFRNLVGRLDGIGVEGDLMFDTANGDITLEKIKGSTTFDTGSGDVKATAMDGSVKGNTGSGDIDLDDFEGDVMSCTTGSGDVTIGSGSAHKLELQTGSGDVRADDVDVEEIIARTGSGSVMVSTRGDRLTALKADTGSGDVTLMLP